jgi:hypothetical protein
MATATETTTTVAAPSMADLRAMAGGTKQAETPVSRETTETEEQSEEQNTETESGTVSEEPQEEEFELPKNVLKKIAQEAKKEAFFRDKINKSVSARKAAEAEAAKLNGKSGSEPGSSAERNTEPAKDADPEPEEPDFATFNGTGLEFQQALKEFKVKLRGWNARQNEALVESKLAEREMTILRKQAWDKAVVEHGEEFPKLMDALRDATTEPFQKAVSLLDHWDIVAVHLAKNEDERNAFVELFNANPDRAKMELGKLEDRLKPAAKTEATETQPVKRPLRAVAGGALGIAPRIDLNKAPMSVFKGEINRMLGKK